jgi:hypothetical protein
MRSNFISARKVLLLQVVPSVDVVTGWLGISPRVALKHYAMITDTHFEVAVNGPKLETTRNPTQTTRANDGQDLPAVRQKHENPEKYSISQGLVKSKVERSRLSSEETLRHFQNVSVT